MPQLPTCTRRGQTRDRRVESRAPAEAQPRAPGSLATAGLTCFHRTFAFMGGRHEGLPTAPGRQGAIPHLGPPNSLPRLRPRARPTSMSGELRRPSIARSSSAAERTCLISIRSIRPERSLADSVPSLFRQIEFLHPQFFHDRQVLGRVVIIPFRNLQQFQNLE